jgi:hypothetical protein
MLVCMSDQPTDAAEDVRSRLLQAIDAGGDICAPLAARLKVLLPGFRIGPGAAFDGSGNRSDTFDLTISRPGVAGADIPAADLAAVIYVCNSLDAQTLSVASAQIARAKSLRKPSAARRDQSTVTLGVIVAARTWGSLNDLADQLKGINESVPSRLWVDAVSVLGQSGYVGLAMRFPKDEKVGTFLPPAENAFAESVPPIYVHLCGGPTSTDALDRTLALIAGHVRFFEPGASLSIPPGLFGALRGDMPIVATYQYNLGGEAKQIGAEQAIDSILATRKARIQTTEGELLLSLLLTPWQDGSVIVAEGPLPLLALLVYYGDKRATKVFKSLSGERQFSGVLPLSPEHFTEMLMRMEERSNLVVFEDKGSLTMTKISDEGTASPFVPRLNMTPLMLRDVALEQDKAAIAEFDGHFAPLMEGLAEVRDAGKNLIDLWTAHEHRVRTGEVAHVQGSTPTVTEVILRPISKEMKSLINSVSRSLKIHLQALTKALGTNIGFVFQEDANFAAGAEELAKTDNALAEYLRQSRPWTNAMMKLRISLEHNKFSIPPIIYRATASGGVVAQQPVILGMPLVAFVQYTQDRLNLFVEEVLMWALMRRMPEYVSIAEIPRAQREPNKCERFRTVFGFPTAQRTWVITYADVSFDGA